MKAKASPQDNDKVWALPCSTDMAGDRAGPFGRAMNSLLFRGPPGTGMLP